jgi:hypothetical protein
VLFAVELAIYANAAFLAIALIPVASTIVLEEIHATGKAFAPIKHRK